MKITTLLLQAVNQILFIQKIRCFITTFCDTLSCTKETTEPLSDLLFKSYLSLVLWEDPVASTEAPSSEETVQEVPRPELCPSAPGYLLEHNPSL